MCQKNPTQPAQTPATVNENKVEKDSGKVLFTTINSRGDQLVFSLKNDSTTYSGRLYCNNNQITFINDGFSENSDEPWDETDIFEMAYFLSPDKKQLFVALKPSIAGSCDIFYKVHIYRIDIETQNVQWITNCGAVKVTKNGFDTAEQVKWLNPEASCAEAKFTARHVYYDYNGNIVRKGKVLYDKTVWKVYRTNNANEQIQCIELKINNHNTYP